MCAACKKKGVGHGANGKGRKDHRTQQKESHFSTRPARRFESGGKTIETGKLSIKKTK